MNCHDVDQALSQGSPLPLQAEEHAGTCNRCQQLLSALNSSVPVDPLSPAALRKIAESLADNLRPVRPLAPARYFVGAFVGIFVFIVALSVYRLGAFAIAVMTPLQTTAILSTLAICTGLLVYSLVNQMVPGSRHRISPALLAVGITILVAMVMAVLFQVQQEENFWGNAWACIRAGTLVGALAAVPFWLVLRRGAILSPRMTGAAAGLLAGLAGTSMLEIHCPILDAWHILLSHLGVAILCALAGLAMGLTAEIRGTRSILRDNPESGARSEPF
jgi:hypothetical protein